MSESGNGPEQIKSPDLKSMSTFDAKAAMDRIIASQKPQHVAPSLPENPWNPSEALSSPQGIDEESILRTTGEGMMRTLREAVSPEDQKHVEGIVQSLEYSLLHYLIRPGSDKEVIDLAGRVMSSMSSAVHRGRMDQSLPQYRTDNLKAGLLGAALVLDPDFERIAVNPEDKPLGVKFSELASSIAQRMK